MPCEPWAATLATARISCSPWGKSDSVLLSYEKQLTGIPDLSLDGLSVNVDGPCCKFYADSRLGIQIEFVARESREH